MEISGRGFGGVLVQVLTAPVAVAVDAATYLVSALCVARIGVRESVPDEPRRSPLTEAAEGFRVVVGNRYLRALLGGASTFNLCTEIFMLGVLLYAVPATCTCRRRVSARSSSPGEWGRSSDRGSVRG